MRDNILVFGKFLQLESSLEHVGGVFFHLDKKDGGGAHRASFCSLSLNYFPKLSLLGKLISLETTKKTSLKKMKQ